MILLTVLAIHFTLCTIYLKIKKFFSYFYPVNETVLVDMQKAVKIALIHFPKFKSKEKLISITLKRTSSIKAVIILSRLKCVFISLL